MASQIRSTFFLILLLQIAAVSCKKETCTDLEKNQDEIEIDCGGACAPCAINYPENGAHGLNILDQNTTSFSNSIDYSLSAIVPEGSSILLKFQHGGPDFNGLDVWFYGSDENLTVSEYDVSTGQQAFGSNGSGNVEALFDFEGSASATITIYENGTTEPTRSKSITWN